MEKWIDNNGIFKCFDLQNAQYDKLPKGVYNIGLNLGEITIISYNADK